MRENNNSGGFRRDSNRDSGSGRSFNNDRNSSFQKEMHDAKCADCGNQCKVPFRPTEGRPVYCRDCYGKHRQ